jgi:hypothetical protein
MSIIFLVFIIFIVAAIAVSLALFWHWKTYMPEQRRGAGAFTVYTIGLVVLFMALWSTLAR